MAAGLCTEYSCQSQLAPGRKRCVAHLAIARERRRAYVERNPDCGKDYRSRSADVRLNGELLRLYGISLADYRGLLSAQRGVCAICGQPDPTPGRRLAVDHDHQSGAVRGLLCGKCNKGIGLLGDSEEGLLKALAYVRGEAWRTQ